ncbi:RNA-binding domain superfamily [Sesbania bispinosa]|nr:RNA-binding domain superfamily [Sesbania bispinosa]
MARRLMINVLEGPTLIGLQCVHEDTKAVYHKMQADNGKLFIGGISWDTNEERLKEYFSTYGEVMESVIMKDRTTGRARGFGFIVFSDPAVAERVTKEKHNIDGRMVEAKKAVPRDDQNILSRNSSSVHGSPGPCRPRKIFVGGLASTVKESDFKNYFDQFGTITDVVVMYDHNTQRPRGFGFITYDSEEAVDTVLLKTFHELNGKMVEVKRAVPKELSPGPNHSPLAGYNNYGLSRVNSFLNGFTQGHTPSNVGLQVDGRFSPVAGGRSGLAPFGSGYGMSVNFEPGLNPEFGGNANFNSNLSYGRGLNPYYIDSSNRFGSSIRYDGGNGGSNSFFSSGVGELKETHLAILESAGVLHQFLFKGGNNVSQSNGNLGFGGANNNYGLGTGGSRRSSGTDMAPISSYSASNGGLDGTLSDLYNSSSVYGDTTWQSSNSDPDGSGPFGFGLGGAASGVSAKSSLGYVGGYAVNKRQPNRGVSQLWDRILAVVSVRFCV